MSIKNRLAYQRAWAARNRNKLRAQAKARYHKAKSKYNEKAKAFRLTFKGEKNYREYSWKRSGIKGMTLEKYNTMCDMVDHVCEACGEGSIDPRTQREGALCVDHDHNTGKVRGLLCSACNMVIGHAGDSPTRLLSLVRYLNQRGIM